jgi:hypothetical protein
LEVFEFLNYSFVLILTNSFFI